MNSDLVWLKSLTRNNKGIWGIEYPLGASLDTQRIVKLLSPTCEAEVIHIVRDGGSMKFSESTQGLVEPDFTNIVKRVAEDAAGRARQSICIIVCDFHNANINEQCALIKTARGIQESSISLSCQFVFCGRWSYFAFRSAYRDIHGHTSSPPAESKNILHAPSWSARDVLELISERRLIAAIPSEVDHVACKFLIEQTAGDEFLIRRAVENLCEQQGDWISNIEQVLNELVSAPDVIESIAQRIGSLEPIQKTELTKLLRVHHLVRDYESIDSEQLWLAGLVGRNRLGGGKQSIQIASPLVNTVVRHIIEKEKPGSLALPRDLCFEREAISTAAYHRVAQIENMLRNLVVSEWHAEKGNLWFENLKGTKSPPRDEEEKEEIIKNVLSTLRSELGITSECSKAEPTTQAGSGRAQKTILDTAQNWQNRQRESHAFELSHDNLMHFLTTGELVGVLVSKKNGLHGIGKPFTKENLMAALDEYIAIRSAVAHNQPIKLSTISRLDGLQRKFIDWLTVYADRVVPE